MLSKPVLWNCCCSIVVALSILCFSPIVLKPGVHTPELLGLPRTLWLGILIAFALVAVTLVGGIVHPANDSETDDPEPGSC